MTTTAKRTKVIQIAGRTVRAGDVILFTPIYGPTWEMPVVRVRRRPDVVVVECKEHESDPAATCYYPREGERYTVRRTLTASEAKRHLRRLAA